MRRTTAGAADCARCAGNFNPRPPCGGRLSWILSPILDILFQSTSSVRRTTLTTELQPKIFHGFQSTSSVRRTTKVQMNLDEKLLISIHVLRAEDDIKSTSKNPILRRISIHVLRAEDDQALVYSFAPGRHFNPRPPCGGRRHQQFSWIPSFQFQSTSSVRRTTSQIDQAFITKLISIHVLRAEDDLSARNSARSLSNFNPRPPCGGRPDGACLQCCH